MDNFDLRKYISKGEIYESIKVGDIVTVGGEGDKLKVIKARKMFGSNMMAYVVKFPNGKEAEYASNQLKLAEDKINEGHGLSMQDVGILRYLVSMLKKDIKIQSPSGRKDAIRVLNFLIKSNILQDKTKDLSKGKAEEGHMMKGDDLDVGHVDDEPGMLKAELARAGKMVQMLYDAVDKYDGKGEVDFPQWWQKKIIQANAMLDSAFDYLDGKESVAKIDAIRDMSEEVTKSEEEELKKIEKELRKASKSHKAQSKALANSTKAHKNQADRIASIVKEAKGQNIEIGNITTQHFDMCPGAVTLFKRLMAGDYSDGRPSAKEMEEIEAYSMHFDLLFGLEKDILAKKKILDFDQADAIAVAKDIANQIMTKREKFNIPADDLEFINQHIEVIEKNSDYLGK